MKRRTFMQAALATPLIVGLPTVRDATAAQGKDWRTYEVITKLEIANPCATWKKIVNGSNPSWPGPGL